jgi:hypothetical protein
LEESSIDFDGDIEVKRVEIKRVDGAEGQPEKDKGETMMGEKENKVSRDNRPSGLYLTIPPKDVGKMRNISGLALSPIPKVSNKAEKKREVSN